METYMDIVYKTKIQVLDKIDADILKCMNGPKTTFEMAGLERSLKVIKIYRDVVDKVEKELKKNKEKGGKDG